MDTKTNQTEEKPSTGSATEPNNTGLVLNKILLNEECWKHILTYCGSQTLNTIRLVSYEWWKLTSTVAFVKSLYDHHGVAWSSIPDRLKTNQCAPVLLVIALQRNAFRSNMIQNPTGDHGNLEHWKVDEYRHQALLQGSLHVWSFLKLEQFVSLGLSDHMVNLLAPFEVRFSLRAECCFRGNPNSKIEIYLFVEELQNTGTTGGRPVGKHMTTELNDGQTTLVNLSCAAFFGLSTVGKQFISPRFRLNFGGRKKEDDRVGSFGFQSVNVEATVTPLNRFQIDNPSLEFPRMEILPHFEGLTLKEKCPSQVPPSSYQLNHIWNPTNPYLSQRNQRGYFAKAKQNLSDITNVRGRKLRIAAIVEPPFVTKIHKNNTVEGYARDIILVLRNSLGFDFEIVSPTDNMIGLYNTSAKGNWSGILGMLKNGEADFSIHYISMLQIRTHSIPFSAPVGEERWVVMMNRPLETTNGEGLVAPFQKEVWYYLLVSLVLMGPLCYILVKMRCHACRSQPLLATPYSIGGCIWFVYGALMKQGSVLKPIADSSRILFATWWIFVTILTAFYTANLTAYLTLSKIPIPFDSLDKIGYKDDWVARRGDTLEQVVSLETTPNVTGGEIYYKKTEPYPEFIRLRWAAKHKYGKFHEQLDNMTELVRREKVLLLEEQSRIERVIYQDFREMSRKLAKLALRCTFIMSPQPILRVPYGFGFVNATLRDIFAPTINKLAVGGMFNYWKREDLPVKDPCSADSDFRERQLRNGDLKTTYLLCCAGYSLAFVSFLIEIVHKWLTNRKMKSQLVPLDKANLSFYKGNLTVPPGAPTYFDTDKFLKNINGRNYIVLKTSDGRTRLVPKSDGMQALQPVYQPPPLISFGYMS